MKLLIEKTTEYGVVAGQKYYSVYDKAHPVSTLKAGMVIEADLVESKKKPGTVYINKLTILDESAPLPEKPAVEAPKPEAKKPFVPRKQFNNAPKADVNWDEIAMGKVRCSAANAALQSPMLMASRDVEKAIETAEALADWVVKYTFKKAE